MRDGSHIRDVSSIIFYCALCNITQAAGKKAGELLNFHCFQAREKLPSSGSESRWPVPRSVPFWQSKNESSVNLQEGADKTRKLE